MNSTGFMEDPLAIDDCQYVIVKEEGDQELLFNPDANSLAVGQNGGAVVEEIDGVPNVEENVLLPTTTTTTADVPEEKTSIQNRKRPCKPEAGRKRRKMTEEEYKRKRERDRLSTQRRIAAMTPEERKAYHAKRSETVKRIRDRRTPEEIEIQKIKAHLQSQEKIAKKLNIELDDEDFPITVNTTGIGGRSKSVGINLRNFCIFCLRKTTSHREPLSLAHNENLIELLQTVPKAEHSCSTIDLVPVFNQIWESLNRQHGNDNVHWLSSLLPSLTSAGTSFSDLPKMCQFCAEKLESVERLLKEALTAINALRMTISESKFGGRFAWRAVDFERAIKASKMEKESISQTIEFLDDLGGNGLKMQSDPPCSKSSPHPPQSATTFRSFESTDGTSSSAQSLPLLASSCYALPANQKPKELAFGSPAPVKIQVSGNTEGMDFQEECDEDSESDDDDKNDPDYIKSEPEEDDESSSNEEDEDISKSSNENRMGKSTSASHQPEVSDESNSCGNIGGTAYTINTSSTLPLQPFMGTGVRSNLRMPLDPNENITFVTTVDPVTGKDTYTCIIDGCGQTFSSKKDGLKHHQRSKHLEKLDDPSLVCDICDKKFSDPKYIKKHKKIVHPNNKKTLPSHQCDLCLLEILDTESLDHAKTHLGALGEEYLLKCPNPKCLHVFFKIYTLRRHLKSLSCKNFSHEFDHVSKVTKVCEICNFCGKTALQLRAHINQTHESSTKNYSCPIDGCQQRFTYKQSVILHLPQHDIRQGFESQFCTCKKKIQLEEMEEHLRETHDAQEIIKCSQCPFLFANKVDHLDHLFEHRYSGLFCDICNDNVKYSRHAKLVEHYFQVHNIGSKVLCEQCDRSFWSKSTLAEHIRVSHNGEEETPEKAKSFECDQCDKIFKTVVSIRDHKIREHGAKPYCCSICSETFLSNPAFTKHKKEHKGVKLTDEYKCEVEGCGKVFQIRALLKKHHSTMHLRERPYVCELCGKSFAYGSSLKTHMESTHLGSRPRNYVCDICSDSFSSSTILKRHKLIHTGERPFGCEICGQRFRTREVLKRHVEAHARKGTDFRPNGPMKHIRKRVERK